MKIELHLFTNSTKFAPDTSHIENTYASFRKIFCQKQDISVPVVVWCDPNPNRQASSEYLKRLNEKFPKVNVTKGLADGWTTAVKTSKADWLFMLEHDWEFLPTIEFGLDEIVKEMEEQKLWFLRFNRRNNIVKNWDKFLKEQKGNRFDVCFTPGLTNKPQIIHRETYTKKALPLIKQRSGSFGIEMELSSKGLECALYGGLNFPPTLKHTDGRDAWEGEKLKSRTTRTNVLARRKTVSRNKV